MMTKKYDVSFEYQLPINFLAKPAGFYCCPFKIGENQLFSVVFTTFAAEIFDVARKLISKKLI
jgi:hypothetical protein